MIIINNNNYNNNYYYNIIIYNIYIIYVYQKPLKTHREEVYGGGLVSKLSMVYCSS